jgi:hypothetical protein
MKSNAELDKKVKTWSVADLVVMTLEKREWLGRAIKIH